MIRRRRHRPEPLRVKGVKVTMTPAPDDAELAAQALLETLCGHLEGSHDRGKGSEPEKGTTAYYRALADRIEQTRQAEKLQALRYLVYAEQQLQGHDMEHLSETESGLYGLQAAVDREGGELKKRWQHCMADIMVKKIGALDAAAVVVPEETILNS